MSLTARLTEKGIAKPPKFLAANVHYETMMGSTAYGVSSDNSDLDVYGFCIPPKDEVFPHLRGEIIGFGTQKHRFNQYQQHHLQDPSANSGKGQEYDLTIYNIVDYFQLCMKNNPNMIDSLFTRETCVLHVTRVGNMVRERRKMFLHKGSWHTFKGYAYAQLSKMSNKDRQGKRKEAVAELGYDCYLESETEFLTDSGWKRFDDVAPGDKVAAVDPATGELRFETPLGRIDKLHRGSCYVVEPALSRCVVTPNHQMLVSPARRSPKTNFSYRYFEDLGEWRLLPLSALKTGWRSWYHVRRAATPRAAEYPIEDEYLKLAGLFVSEGTINFRDGKVRTARLTQTQGGKPEFYSVADNLGSSYKVSAYTYAKEDIWVFDRATAERLYADFGHGSSRKRLPKWTLQLSHRQAGLLWHHLWLGDGTPTPDGQVLYTTNRCLAGDVQAMMVAAGHPCTVRGPYTSVVFGTELTSYQVYVPADLDAYRCVDFKSRICSLGQQVGGRQGWPIKEIDADGQRVVCFEMPSSTLVTRSGGRPAFQGNCKFAYHIVRLLNEAEMILTEGDLDLMRNREQLKSIRRGEWTEEQIREYFVRKEAELEKAYTDSKLPYAPDEAAVKQLLMHCLEEHYGSLAECVVDVDAATAALREVAAVLDRTRGAWG